jgi:hypothetical protein
MGELHHATLSFRIISSIHTGEDITRIVGVAPTGHRIVRQGKTSKTVWYLEETGDQEWTIDTRIRSLVARVTGAHDTWPEETGHWHKEVFCGLFLETWNEGFSLSSATLQLLAQGTIDLSLDIYDSSVRTEPIM